MFTPTEGRIIDLLSDGLPHHRKELMALLNDDRAEYKTLSVHIFRMRQKLRPHGQDITTEVGRGYKIMFRHVRLLASAYAGYK